RKGAAAGRAGDPLRRLGAHVLQARGRLGHLPVALARPIHELSAATSRLAASAVLRSLRGLNDLFKVVSGALGRESLHLRPFATFRSKPHEYGLALFALRQRNS